MEQMRRFMDEAVQRLGIPGIDCIIYQNHEEVFRHAAGDSEPETGTPVKKDALYNIYSATKPITCVSALQLVEKGELLLEDPLYAYLPEYKDMWVKLNAFRTVPARKHILISDLFSMQAGFGYDYNVDSLLRLREETDLDFSTRDFARALAEEPLMFEPGEDWNYSFCHDVLAAVVEVVTGKTISAYMKEHIFDSLGMKDTGFTVPAEKTHRIAPQYHYDVRTGDITRIGSSCHAPFGTRQESGGGGLVSTTEDYTLFADALACGGVGKSGARILSPNTIKLMHTNRLHGKSLESYYNMKPAGMGYGLGVANFDDPAAACAIVPKDSFYWGGIGGVQNLFDPVNKLSYVVTQHLVSGPKWKLNTPMWNILYADPTLDLKGL